MSITRLCVRVSNCSRESLYLWTARRMVMIVGREAAIDQMIRNVNTRKRYSALCWRLTELMNL